MANLLDAISGFILGNDLEITRTISGLSDGQTLVKAWLTIKTAESQVDPGVLQKAVTTANVTGVGQITDDGAVDGVSEVRFDLTPTDTLLLTNVTTGYVFDIQVKTSGLKIYTPFKGIIVGKKRVTTTTS